MLPACGKFLDRVGGGEALLGPAGAWQPMVCGTKVKGDNSLLAYGQAQQHHCPCWIGSTPCNLQSGCTVPLLWDGWSKPVPVPLGARVCFGAPSSPFMPHFCKFSSFQDCSFLARQPHGVVLSPKRCNPDPTAKEQQCYEGTCCTGINPFHTFI